MAVPAHDERDFAFAKKFGLLLKPVVAKFTTHVGISAPREGVETLVRDCVDLIIEHPTDGTFLVQKKLTVIIPIYILWAVGLRVSLMKLRLLEKLEEETGFTDFEIIGNSIVTFVRTRLSSQLKIKIK
jgi:hypothetical protein